MTPKEKAKELVDKFIQTNGNAFFAKECALIAVNNELELIMWLNLLCNFDNPMKKHFEEKISELKKVKQEIEKL